MTKAKFRLVIKIELILLAVVSALLTIQALMKIPSVKNAVVLATTIKPETFTELYFEDHLSLPNKIVYYQPQKFAFTIHNLENQDLGYSYEVYIYVKGEKQFIDQGFVFVKNNEYKTLNEEFTLIFSTSRIKVVVNLLNKNQAISFWVGEE